MTDNASVIDKNAHLEEVKKQLKKEFIGIDGVIDRIINLIRSWYLLPELQQRPQVINLWGLTGVGKTSLINRLAELLDFKDRYQLINYTDKVGNGIGNELEDMYDEYSGKPLMIAFDEFQHARTMDPMGNSKRTNDSLWSLLGSGSVRIQVSHFRLEELREQIRDMIHFLNTGVHVKNGRVVKGKKHFLNYMDKKSSSRDIFSDTLKPDLGAGEEIRFMGDEVFETVYEIRGNEYSTEFDLREYVDSLDGKQTVSFLKETFKKALEPKLFDCSQAIIFIIGNIDEAYDMHASLDPDEDADYFYERSRKIDISDIKSVLRNYFRSEQIARLGNNHVIYPALDKKAYRDIIQLELNKLRQRIADKYDLAIRFDESVNQTIYREGVYPAQGTRPVFSTIFNLIEANLGKIIYQALLHKFDPDHITISVEDKKLNANYIENGKRVHQIAITLQLALEDKRKTPRDDLQAINAVHESGRVIANIILRNRIPDHVISHSSEQSRNGKTILKNFDRFHTYKSMKAHAAILLAGYCAEEIVFGDEYVTDLSGRDLYEAKSFLSKKIGRDGLGSFDKVHNLNMFGDDYIQQLLAQARDRAMEVLKNHKNMLLKLADYLSEHRKLDNEGLVDLLELTDIKCELLAEDEGDYSHRRALKDHVRRFNKLQPHTVDAFESAFG